jgi:AraC-like DNA-binding protein
VWCLAVGIGGPLTVATSDCTILDAHSVLIPPRQSHQLACRGSGLVSCYLEPASSRADASRLRFGGWCGSIGVGHLAEERLQVAPDDDESACCWLDLAAPVAHHVVDPRISAAARRIRDEPATTISSRELAAAAGLSESRFLHLIRDESGTTLRRYRLWVRLMQAGAAIAAGDNLTAAAMKAVFASPSHLADRFKTTFGVSASQLFGTGVTLRTP